MTSRQLSSFKGLISPVLHVSDSSVASLKKSRLRFIHTLNIHAIDPSILTNLKHCIKHTKRIRSLNTSCPSKRLNDAVASSLKGLQRIYIAKDEDNPLKVRVIKTIHRRLSTLQFYRGVYQLKDIPIFRSLREVKDLEVVIKEKSFKPIKLDTLGAKIRYIHGLKRVCLQTLRTTLTDFLDLMGRLPRTQKFKLKALELDLPKNLDELQHLTLLSKIEALEIDSASKRFIEFFVKNIDDFENLELLKLSQNGPTILKLNEWNDYSLFSKFINLESLRFLKLYFRFPFPATPTSPEFFNALRLPVNLEKLSLNLANVSLAEKGYEVSTFGKIFRQIEDFKQLRSLHLNLDLESSSSSFSIGKLKNNIDEVFGVLPMNMPTLKAVSLDLFSGEFMTVNLYEIFKWASTHENLEYLHLTMPGIGYQGFESVELQENTFKNLRILHVMSTDRNYFQGQGFEDFLKFISQLKELRTLQFNCWGSNCTAIDIQNILKHVKELQKLDTLTLSADAQNIDFEEFLLFKELLRDIQSLRYLFLFIRKRGYDVIPELIQKFEDEFRDEKNKMKNRLGFFLNQQILL